jgi:hypothetical protein
MGIRFCGTIIRDGRQRKGGAGTGAEELAQ